MTGFAQLVRRLWAEPRGSTAVETAIVAPVLALLSLGAFQVSYMVARQNELQSAAAEAAAIVLISPPETSAEISEIADVIRESTGLGADQVAVTRVHRCGMAASYVSDAGACAPGEEVSTFLMIRMTDTYAPEWTKFGVGEPLTFDIRRTVQVS